MVCKKCGTTISDDSVFCMCCGKKQVVQSSRKRLRANGDGSVYQLPSGKWRAVRTLGYTVDGNKKQHRTTQSRSDFKLKKDAVSWLASGVVQKNTKKISFKAMYDKWLPTHRAGPDTLNCYKAAIKYFKAVWTVNIDDLELDDLQECLDECPKGKRTRQNMKAVCGLVFKYGIPRGFVVEKLNLAQFLIVNGDDTVPKASLSTKDVEKIGKLVGKTEGANYVYAQIYLGFRPSEFLALDAANYDKKEKAFIGGGKTDAGTNRVVTVSPKIKTIIDGLTKDKIAGPIFCSKSNDALPIKDYRSMFYSVLESANIDNPVTEVDGANIHKFTPHSCRHTFATLMKRVQGADKDKLELIGHTSNEMLRYYQDVNLDDLRRITDAI